MQKEIICIQEAITSLDGRNRRKLLSLVPIFSDLALLKFRVQIELFYFQKLSRAKIIRKLTLKEKSYLKNFPNTIGEKEYLQIREIEKRVNHDVKAMEEFLKEKLRQTSLKDIAEMIHFGLTSDDTNNLSYAKILQIGLNNVLLPDLQKIQNSLKEKSFRYKNLVFLGRTHGQPAIPTTFGKEIFIFYTRLSEEIQILKALKIKAKLTGNVGNLNAHKFIFPKNNWLKFSSELVSDLGFVPDLTTTQIEPYDSYIRIFQSIERVNNILSGLCQDFWYYISLGCFKQKILQKEVGSTALPHKVNPIYFEGAEGGLGLANALFNFYSRKLAYSRLQRDLSDSIVRRSFGIAFAYSLLSYQSLNIALDRIEPDLEKIKSGYKDRFEILSEAVQNFLRTLGQENAYDRSKAFFRGQEINQQEYQRFIKSLKLTKPDEQKLLNLKPETYIGYAEEIVNQI